MRFRFSIRDLLWLTLVVALIVGWRISVASTINENAKLRRNLERSEAGAKINRDGAMDVIGKLNAKIKELRTAALELDAPQRLVK